jgi:hypothetical protein
VARLSGPQVVYSPEDPAVKSPFCVLSTAAPLMAALAAAGAQPVPTGGPALDFRAPRLVFASYAYGYQGDARRGSAPRLVRLASGATALTHHPWESTGPWFSGERPQWHRNQLQLMQGAGIDVALALFQGSASGRRDYAIRGLDALVEALKELRSPPAPLGGQGCEYPQVGLALDLASLAEQYGGSVNLKDADAQRSLYGMIREFYLRVPEEFRASVQLASIPQAVPDAAPEAASVPRDAGTMVRLTGGEWLRDADASFTTYCSRRFEHEFGSRLVWIGTPDMRSKIPGLDAYAAPLAAAGPARFEKGALLTTASLGPGFENALGAGDGSARSRGNGSAYIVDWRAALEAQPQWIFLDSWNDFSRGSDLAPSLEYGLQYRDLTRGATLQFKATPAALQHAGSIARTALPRLVQPGLLYPVDVLVKNDGSADWDAFTQISLSYRWLQDGKPVSDVGPAVAVAQPRGEMRSYTIGVAAPMRASRPLPTGRYEIQIGLVQRTRSGESWLDENAVFPYRATVQVGAAPALRPYWLSSGMATSALTGATCRATLRLRNDGSAVWRPGDGVSLACRIRRVSTYLKGFAEDGDELIAEGPKTLLPDDVPPGRLLTMRAEVPLVDRQGKPLPVWTPASPWSYVLEWDLWDGKRWSSAVGVPGLREVLEVVDRDPAPTFLGCNLAAELVAGRTEKVIVGLRNMGPDGWKAGRDRVAVHWYYLDGTEAAWNDSGAPLPQDVPPYSEATVRTPTGQRAAANPSSSREELVVQDTIVRDVPVIVPRYFGPMYCVFDLIHDGQPASTAPGSKGTDILVVPVNVYSPDFLPVPLTPFFDTDGISSDLNRADGNLDGRGNSIPAESLPPFVTRPTVGTGPAASPIYPCGLWVRALNQPPGDPANLPRDLISLDPQPLLNIAGSHRVSFLYPGKGDRTPNMVACDGQRLPLVAAPRAAIHVLAVATAENVTGEFTLVYEDATTEARKVAFTHYTDPPAHGEHAAFVVAHRHTQKGDDLQSRCYLDHYVLKADPRKSLAALDLPREKSIKIMAITLESGSQGKG